MIYASKGFFAAIGIKYPIGDTCTCSDGKVTYTAPDQSGWWLFEVPHKGTWTAKIVINGNFVNNEVVSKSADILNGDVVEITLTPWDGELYMYGNQYSTIMTTSGAVTLTGGWAQVGTKGSVALQDYDIKMTSSGGVDGYDSWSSCGDVAMNATINMSNYTTLTAVIEYGDYRLLQTTMSVRTARGASAKAASVYIGGTTGKLEKTTALDITNLGAETAYLVEFVAGYSYPTSAVYYVTQVYLSGGAKSGIINVSYPLGSTCSITNGTKTLTANPNFDSCSFTRLTAGTWTVKITNGSKTVSKIVTLTRGASVDVTLKYS